MGQPNWDAKHTMGNSETVSPLNHTSVDTTRKLETLLGQERWKRHTQNQIHHPGGVSPHHTGLMLTSYVIFQCVRPDFLLFAIEIKYYYFKFKTQIVRLLE